MKDSTIMVLALAAAAVGVVVFMRNRAPVSPAPGTGAAPADDTGSDDWERAAIDAAVDAGGRILDRLFGDRNSVTVSPVETAGNPANIPYYLAAP
jgi:hypothetical protein